MKKFLINLFRFLRNGLSPARRYRYIRLSPIIFGKVFIFDKVEKKLLKVYAKTSSDLYTIDAILVNEEYKFQKYKTWGKYFTGDRPITFVDVGANIGIASFYMMNEFKKISTISALRILLKMCWRGIMVRSLPMVKLVQERPIQ